jgi:tricorn protease
MHPRSRTGAPGSTRLRSAPPLLAALVTAALAMPLAGGAGGPEAATATELVAPRAGPDAAGLPLASPETVPARSDRSFGFGQDPHIHQGRVVFSLRGDLWTVGTDGSDPRQLTRHEARDTGPRFSPDGRWIAFTSNRLGNADVWVIPAEGGEPRQLTFHSGGDVVVTWTPDARRVVFRSGRGFLQWHQELWSVSVDGDLPVRLPLGSAIDGSFASDGSFVAFNRNRTGAPKRNYRGSTAGSIWVADLAGADDSELPAFAQLTNTDLEGSQSHANDAVPMVAADGWIYFKSERDGVYNLWRVAPSGGDAEQVTFHARGGVQFPSIGTDGRTIAYANDFDLWLYEIGSAEPRVVSMDLGWTVRTNQVEFVAVSNEAEHFAPSPDGAYLTVDTRGEIFIVPAEQGVGEITRVTDAAWRQRGGLYAPDGRTLAYLSDASGDDEIWLYTLATGEHRQLTRQGTRKSMDFWSPDGAWIYFRAETTLYRVRVEGGAIETVASHRSGGYTPTHLTPDGGWLVAHRASDLGNVDVHLRNLADGRSWNLTDHPSRSWNGTLTADGRHLLFLSNREGGTTQLFSVALARPVEDPDDPRVRERERQARGEAEAREEGGAAGALAPDLTDISRRARQLTTRDAGVASYFLSRDGATVYYVTGTGQNRALRAMNLDGTNDRQIAEGAFADLKVTGDRRAVFFREGNRIHRLVLQSRERTPLAFQYSFVVDRRAEWRQMFDELYRHWKYSYVEEEMFGLDWDAVRARYEPMVERIGETEDFYRLGLEMLHEVPSSHSGISPPPSGGGGGGGNSTRHLGFHVEPEAGGLRIAHLYRDGPADRIWLDLAEGDWLVAIEGTPVDASTNFWPLLTNLVNEYLTVRVADAPDGRNGRDLRIRTVGNTGNLAYDDWVTRNREYVEEATNGRIHYVHIRSMNQASLEQFQQELDENFHREGIIIDVRYNGGGNIDQQLMDILQRRPYQYTWTRTESPLLGRRPQQIIYGPQVMMHNWRSGSNAEMVPHAFRELGLGTLVGTPTAGAVVSASNLPLKDGGSVRVPRVRVVSYDPEQPYNFGYNLENYGVPPDLWVRNDPADELRGHDRELEAAVAEALRLLATGRWQYVNQQQNDAAGGGAGGGG